MKNLITKVAKKVGEAYNHINNNFYVKDAAIAGLTVSGPIVLYLGTKDAFISDSLNILSKIYGVGATSAVLTHYTNNFIEEMKSFRKIVKYAERQKRERDRNSRD